MNGVISSNTSLQVILKGISKYAATHKHIIIRKSISCNFVHCPEDVVRFKCLKFRLCKTFKNQQHHKQRYFCPPKNTSYIENLVKLYQNINGFLSFCHIFNKVTSFYSRFLYFYWSEIIVFMIKLDLSSLACGDTIHQTQNSK